MKTSLTFVDYTLLGFTLLLSLGIGLYHAVFRKQNTATEYLHGGKNMNFLGIGLSIGASLVSGVSMISLPTDTYYYGIQYGLQISVLMIPTAIISYYFVCPIFFKLQLTSVFTYMELRFDAKVMKLTSALNTVPMLLYATMITYVTALTIAQITDVDVQIICAVIAVTCIVYTIFGGFKAIIWTDAFQVFIMVTSIIAVCTIIIQQTGGIKNVVDIAFDSERLTIDFDIDPTKRDTFLATFCSALIQLPMSFTFGQGTIQRFTSLRNYKDVKHVHILSVTLWIIMIGSCVFCGVIAAARYMFCDPFSMKQIKKPDQLLPFAVLEIGNAIPGFPGIFMAGIITGGLSTLSTTLNSLAATLYIDFIKPALSSAIVEKYEVLAIKLVVLTVGVLTIGLVYVIQHLGTVLTVLLTISPIAYAPLNGMFVAGVFMPNVNAKGVFWGAITTIIVLSWLIVSAQWYKLKGLIKYPTLPVYTSGCQGNNDSLTTTFQTNSTLYSSDEVPSIYKLSYHYYPVVGSIVSIAVALVISCLFKDRNHNVKDDLLSPIVRYFRRRRQDSMTYNTVDMAMAVTDTAVANNIKT